MNLKRTSLPFLAALLLSSAAQADHTSANLKDFRTVCVNAATELRGIKDQDLLEEAIDQITSGLEEADIKLVDAPCQEKGTSTTRQLNLFYTFSTTKDGSAYFAQIEAWVITEGKYTELTLWSDYFFGSPGKDKLKDLALDNAQILTDSFIKAWDKSH